jgi:ribose-phosphate pyrophosphokinase
MEDDDDDEARLEGQELGDPDLLAGLVLVGDVKDRIAFILDDILDSPRAFLAAAKFLKINGGAKKVFLVATHAILSEDAAEEIAKCDAVNGIIVTNTYPIGAEKERAMGDKLAVIDISAVLAEAIRRTHNGESISYLFDAAV